MTTEHCPECPYSFTSTNYSCVLTVITLHKESHNKRKEA